MRWRTVSKGSLIDNLANFLSISPNQTKFVPMTSLKISAQWVFTPGGGGGGGNDGDWWQNKQMNLSESGIRDE